MFPGLENTDKPKRDFMITSLCSRKKVTPEESSDLLLKLMACLDTSETQHFDKMKKNCVDDLAVKAMRNKIDTQKKEHEQEAEEAAAAASSRKKRKAPAHPEGEEKTAKKTRMQGLTEEQAAQRRVKAPKELLKFFPDIDYVYLKYFTKTNKVTIEFVHKERS